MSDILTLPVRRGVPAQTFQVTLDGRPFVFELDWISRIGRWMFSLSTGGGTSIVKCKGLCLNADILRSVRYNPLAPQGVLYVQDLLGLDQEATLENLGERVRLLYFSLVEE